MGRIFGGLGWIFGSIFYRFLGPFFDGFLTLFLAVFWVIFLGQFLGQFFVGFWGSFLGVRKMTKNPVFHDFRFYFGISHSKKSKNSISWGGPVFLVKIGSFLGSTCGNRREPGFWGFWGFGGRLFGVFDRFWGLFLTIF